MDQEEPRKPKLDKLFKEYPPGFNLHKARLNITIVKTIDIWQELRKYVRYAHI